MPPSPFRLRNTKEASEVPNHRGCKSLIEKGDARKHSCNVETAETRSTNKLPLHILNQKGLRPGMSRAASPKVHEPDSIVCERLARSW